MLRLALAGLATVLVAVPLTVSVSAAQAVSHPHVHAAYPTPTRIQGTDRYDQAVKVSATTGSAEFVYLASGEIFADALSTAAVAARHGSPLLLTPRDTVPEGVIAEILRLRPTTIVVVGGPASVSESVLERLSQRVAGATVVRIEGDDRYEVSRALLAEPTVGAIRADTVFAVAGATFPDALTATPAAVHMNLSPVLLMDGSQSSVSAAENALLDGLGADDVHLVGGLRSLNADLQASLSSHRTVTRSEGADRFETGVAVNQRAFRTATTVYLASGTSFPDALSGGPLAARSGAPLYVVPKNCVPSSVLEEVVRLQAQRIVILGGPLTLGPGVDSLTPC